MNNTQTLITEIQEENAMYQSSAVTAFVNTVDFFAASGGEREVGIFSDWAVQLAAIVKEKGLSGLDEVLEGLAR